MLVHPRAHAENSLKLNSITKEALSQFSVVKVFILAGDESEQFKA